MRRFFAYLLAFIVAVVLGVSIAHDPGYAIFHYRHTTVSMPLWLATLAFIIIFIVVIIILRIFNRAHSTFIKIGAWRKHALFLRAQEKGQRGLLEMIEGHYETAELYLKDSLKKSATPLINYLSAAQAAHELGAYERRDDYFLKAQEKIPSAKIPIYIMQAELLLQQHNLDAAEKIILRLKKLAPKHKTVLKLLKELYIQQQHFDKLLSLLPLLERYHILSNAEAMDLKTYCERQLLKKAAHDAPLLQQCFASFSRKSQADLKVIGDYVEYLLLLHQDELAESLLIKTLKKDWNIHCVRLYGLTQSIEPHKQFSLAEKWLTQHPDESELLLVLGQLALRLKLWGKARVYLENSLTIEPRKITHQCLAQLHEQLNEKELALVHYRKAAEL